MAGRIGDGGAKGRLTLRFSTTLFVSAMLLFTCQPLVARMIVPLLGGAASVWIFDDLYETDEDREAGKDASEWVLLVPAKIELPRWKTLEVSPAQPVWSDDSANVLGVLR